MRIPIAIGSANLQMRKPNKIQLKTNRDGLSYLFHGL